MGFVVDKVELGQIFLPVFEFSPVKYHSTAAPYSVMYDVGDGQRVH
jgi:hypothetical protein